MDKATFAAGCFWGTESKFSCLDGVIETSVGYSGGKTENPTYEDVCSDETGHAECTEILYDPDKISYAELLKVFWEIHDPTTKDQQGADFGSQYRSVIFYHNEEQKKLAELSLQQLEKSGKYKNKIVTEIIPAQTFFKAEDYHQHFYQKQNWTCKTKQAE